MNTIVQANYEALELIAARFGLQADAIEQMQAALRHGVNALRDSGWMGMGAQSFFATMDNDVGPAVERLNEALREAQVVIIAGGKLIKHAEEVAAAAFREHSLTLGLDHARASPPHPASQPSSFGGIGDVLFRVRELINQLMVRGSVSEEQALEIFRDMADEPDIPFNYGDDGCYARSYVMAKRLAQRYGIDQTDTAKVFLFGDLQVATEHIYSKASYPGQITSHDGVIDWRYHVAPAIKVQQSDGTAVWKIIDPSIADRPVTIAEWKQSMGDSAAEVDVRGHAWYHPNLQVTEANQAEVEASANATMKKYLARCEAAGYCK